MKTQVEFILQGPYKEEWDIGDRGVIEAHVTDINGQHKAVVILYKDGRIVIAPYYMMKAIDPASL